MALFQPMQQGPSGSAVTPKAEVQDTSVNSILDFVGKAGTGLAGMFQDQAKSRSQQAVGTALTAFIDEQSRIAEAAEQGLDPAQARTRMRAAFNKHAANNPLLLDEFLKVQKAYAESQMGEAVTKGSVAYQEEQAKKIELQKQAAQDGFTDPDKWLIWEGQKRSWEKTNQANNEQLARLRAEATRASTDASRKAAALSQAKTEEIKIRESHNDAIFKDMAGNIDGAWKAAESVIHMPGTTEQKVSQGERMIQQLKSRLVGTYNKADQTRINTVLGNLDKLQEYMNDAIVQGKTTTALQNQIDILKDSRIVSMLGDEKTRNLLAASSIVGPGYLSMAPTQSVQVVQGLMNFTEKPSERKGPPAPMNAEGWAAMDKFLLGQSKAEQLPQYEVPVETVAEHQLVGAIQSMTLYGDGYASDDDVKGFLNMASGGGYELLKRSGPINIPPEAQGKYSQFLARTFEGVSAEIKNEYADAVVSSYKAVGGGIGQSVETEQFQSAAVIEPVVENGTFKFVAKIPEAKAEAERLNKRITPVIMKFAKAVAVGNGDPDLTKALKQVLPRVIEGEIPQDELAARGVKINQPPKGE